MFKEYLHVSTFDFRLSTYDFKAKISQYLRYLRAGHVRAIIIQKYEEPVAIVLPYKGQDKDFREEEAQKTLQNKYFHIISSA